MLTKEAFNALLKTLEEPPAHVKFFFATTDPQKIPPTIMSRVQKFELRRMDWNTLNGYLSRMAEREGLKASPDAIAAVARAGNGSMRDALSVFDQVLAWGGETVTEKDVAALLGQTDREIILELNSAVAKKDHEAALRCVAKVMESGRDAEQFLLTLIQFFRDQLILKVSRDPGNLLEESPEHLKELKEAAGAHSVNDLMQSIDELLKILPKLSATEAKQTILELAVLKLIHIRSRISPDEIFERLRALEQGSVIREKEKETQTNQVKAPENSGESGDVALARQLFPGSRSK